MLTATDSIALTMAVNQAEESQPGIQLLRPGTSWTPGENGSPVLIPSAPQWMATITAPLPFFSPQLLFPYNKWLHRLPGKVDANSNSSSACLGARFPICWEITLNTRSCGAPKAMLEIPNPLDQPLGPSSSLAPGPMPVVHALLPCSCRPQQGLADPRRNCL